MTRYTLTSLFKPKGQVLWSHSNSFPPCDRPEELKDAFEKAAAGFPGARGNLLGFFEGEQKPTPFLAVGRNANPVPLQCESGRSPRICERKQLIPDASAETIKVRWVSTRRER